MEKDKQRRETKTPRGKRRKIQTKEHGMLSQPQAGPK